MKHIDENKIEYLLANNRDPETSEIDSILQKSKKLERLSLEDVAVLLSAYKKEHIDKIFQAASDVKNAIYGKRIVMFAPLYISNICSNNCLYCAFRADNKSIERNALSIEEVKNQIKVLLKQGHMRILVVAGEAKKNVAGYKNSADYFADVVKAIYSVQVGKYKIKRVNINCAPLSVEEFKIVKDSGIGTYQIFQETYHDETYRKVHPKGPKSDPDNRIDALNNAFKAGIDDVGIGVLFGLYDYKFEILAMLMHIEYLESKWNVGPHTISVPRIEPAYGAPYSTQIPHKVSDDEFKRIVAILRLAVPYTGIILSTRESPEMRDQLFGLGISQVSAGSKISPGGYEKDDKEDYETGQFSVSDHRSLDEVINSLIEYGHIPSFCAACYRKERTGEAFMHLAKPGEIKTMCQLNALITLKEYLEDFASPEVKIKGYALIEKMKKSLPDNEKKTLEGFYKRIDEGKRDEYV